MKTAVWGKSLKPSQGLMSASEDERYRLLVDSITDYAIYMLDPEGLVVSWNPGARRLKGYELREILGQHFSRFYTEEDKASGLPQQALAAARDEGRFEREGWRVRKDGSRFWALVVIDPIRAPSGELIGYAKITRDLSERKRAEESLRQSEEQFRLLVQGVSDYAIYMLDPTGRVTNWNQGAQRIKGYTPAEIIGEHFSRFYSEEDRAAGLPERGLETARREGRFEKEGWRYRKDGTRFWANVIIDAIHNDAGELIGFAKITRDVTEKRETERALQQAQEALFQSQKLEAIGQLTGGVAHDFNNLLMAILGSLEMAKKRLPDDDRVVRLLDNAIQAGQRGASLTQRMLSFARRQDLKTGAVDLPLLVRGMTDLLQRSIGPTISIQTRFPLVLAPALTDPNQLETALLNLAVNARDAMPQGGTITIGADEETLTGDAKLPDGRYVQLWIADTGEGMDEATLAHAMEPFFTTKGIGKGTGLGLSMVHGLAEQSGGRMTIRSRPGEGTRVELLFPIAEAVAVEAATVSAGEAQASPHGYTVLAVDDDGLVLMNTVMMLEDMGHIVFSANSGEEALEIAAREKIDLVITDQAMPRMTGAQLAEALHQKQPSLPVILATGYAELPKGQGGELPKLQKPFMQQDLAKAIVSTMHKR